METLDRLLVSLVEFAWGMPLIILLVGGGLTLSIMSRGIPLLRMGHAVALLRGRYDDDRAPGELGVAHVAVAVRIIVQLPTCGGSIEGVGSMRIGMDQADVRTIDCPVSV